MNLLNVSDIIYENHESYLSENYNEFKTNPIKATTDLLVNDYIFNSYLDKLTEGLDDDVKKVVVSVCNRERQSLLEEMNVGPDVTAIAYAVNMFPIIADIFAEPILSKLCTVHTVAAAKITIPRIRYKAIIRNYDGSTTELYVPTSRSLVRTPPINVTLQAGVNNDLFALASLSSANYRVNRRNFVITGLKVVENPDTAPTEYTITGLYFRPDIRGGFTFTATFEDGNGDTVTVNVVGIIDWAKGTVQFSGTFSGGSNTYKLTELYTQVGFRPINVDNGRVLVRIENEAIDVDIDVADDFELELTEEDLQDFRDIFNIDALRNVSQAVKAQMLLNVDYDIISMIRSAEPNMAGNSVCDYSVFSSGGFAPASLKDLFFAIVPKILSVARQVRSVFNAMPQNIVCSHNAAPLLESLKKFSVAMDDASGNLNVVAEGREFSLMNVVASAACPDNRVYVVYKAPAGNKSRAAIINLVNRPMYIISETTGSVRKTYIRSRQTIELVRPDAMGYVELRNYANLI